MANIDNKNEVKTCSEFDTSSCSSLDDEEDMPYDVLLQKYHMISLYCKKFKEKFKTFVSKNIELRKSNEDPDSRRESKSGMLIDETSTSEKLREEVAWHTKDFRKFLESSKTLTTLSKFHQCPHDKSGLGFEKGTTSSKSRLVLDKCDFCGKFGHSKFKCIHKKKKMSKATNYVGPKKI